MDKLQRRTIIGDYRIRDANQYSARSASPTAVRANQLKIGTWNVRGANDEGKRTNIDEQLAALQLDLIVVQETKLT